MQLCCSDHDGGMGRVGKGGRQRKTEDLMSSSSRGSGLTPNAKFTGSAMGTKHKEIVAYALFW